MISGARSILSYSHLILIMNEGKCDRGRIAIVEAVIQPNTRYESVHLERPLLRLTDGSDDGYVHHEGRC